MEKASVTSMIRWAQTCMTAWATHPITSLCKLVTWAWSYHVTNTYTNPLSLSLSLSLRLIPIYTPDSQRRHQSYTTAIFDDSVSQMKSRHYSLLLIYNVHYICGRNFFARPLLLVKGVKEKTSSFVFWAFS